MIYIVVIIMNFATINAGSFTLDLGQFGHTFPIIEQSLSEVILAKLQKLEASGDLAKHQKIIQDKVLNHVKNPKSVAGIRNALAKKQFHYNPEITLNNDLKDHKGTIIYPAGTTVNPLDTRPMTKPLLFIDGSDHRQIAWAQGQLQNNPLAKVILVKGSPFDPQLQGAMGERPIFFDQGGKITQKLGIKEVPAIVTQDGSQLLISIEVPND